ncbi:hypothetical protein AU495_06265 [Lonsdalea populi]|nr:hypothetical protein AU495_06265 [Lonsdalea populi]
MDTIIPTFKRLRSIAVFVERIARKFAPNSRFANWSLWLRYDAEALCDVALKSLNVPKLVYKFLANLMIAMKCRNWLYVVFTKPHIFLVNAISTV